MDGLTLLDFGLWPNDQVLSVIKTRAVYGGSPLAIEMVASYGMAVGAEIFETCVWIGRFAQAASGEWTRVYRRDVKSVLCGTQQAKDPNIRRAILDLYPSEGGGATPQIGTKADPGPLYGVKADTWSAIAVGITYQVKAEMLTLPAGPGILTEGRR